MLSQRTQQTAYVRALVDGGLLVVAFVLAFLIRSYVRLPFMASHEPLSFAVHFWLLAIAVPLQWMLGSRISLHGIERHASYLGLLRTVSVTFAYLGLLLGTAIFLFQAKTFSRAVFFLFLALGFVLIAGERALVRSLAPRRRRRRGAERNVMIVGTSPEAAALARKLETHPEVTMRVVGHLAGPGEAPTAVRALGGLEDLRRIVEEQVVDEVVFVLPPAELFSCERQIAWCEEVGVPVHLKMDFIRTLFGRTYPTEFEGTPMLTVSSTPQDPLGLLVKRGLDLAVSVTVLVGLTPVLVAAALAVRLTSRGRIFFSQERIGQNGRVFRLYKLRSMYADAERRRAALEALNEVSGPVFKMRRDPRVTPVGRWLRKFSIDELPQLWNVLRGDMSLVGPRPSLAHEVRRYERWQRRRLSMKPGITCLWQVQGRSHIAFEDWMRLDLHYIDNWSLMLDLKILLRTVPAVMFARGAR